MNRHVPEETVPFIAGVVNDVRRSYPTVPTDDLWSEGYLWVVANPGKVREYLTFDPPREGERMLYSALRNRLRHFARREKAAIAGYRPQDEFFYTPTQIREELLPALFDREAWANPPTPPDGGGGGRTPAHERGGWMASLADVADAYRKLDRETRDMLRMRFADDLPQTRIAEILGLSDMDITRGIERAVNRIHAELGGDRPEYERDEIVGLRRSMSNASAQAITGSTYDG